LEERNWAEPYASAYKQLQPGPTARFLLKTVDILTMIIDYFGLAEGVRFQWAHHETVSDSTRTDDLSQPRISEWEAAKGEAVNRYPTPPWRATDNSHSAALGKVVTENIIFKLLAKYLID
jgi:hypothetical protein